MYIPKLFHEHDWLEIKRVIEQNSFATIVSCDGGVPSATHVPLRLVESADGSTRLQGHFAKANPHWHLLENGEKCLVIFSGPHSYVSPRWYDQVNVPTWNYVAVHVYGKPRLMTDAHEAYELMKGLVNQYEGHTPIETRYTLEALPSDFVKGAMTGIVCFEIAIDEIQASFKLSQNRNEKSYENVITELRKSEDQDAQQVAQLMEQRRPPRP